MSRHPVWMQLAHDAGHAAQHGSKAAAILLIFDGFVLVPALIGFPIMAYGFWKLCS